MISGERWRRFLVQRDWLVATDLDAAILPVGEHVELLGGEAGCLTTHCSHSLR